MGADPATTRDHRLAKGLEDRDKPEVRDAETEPQESGAAGSAPSLAELRAEPVDPREKYQAYVRSSLKKEAQSAVFWTNNQPGGYASLTELTEAALQREIERLRDRFTHGEPFSPMPPGRKLTTRPPAVEHRIQ